jgi:triacylglycerol lipase
VIFMDFKTALQCAILSQEVYQSFGNIRFSEWQKATPVLLEKGKTDTQVAILEDTSQQVGMIVFRGSSSDKDWTTNLDTGIREQDWSKQDKKEYRQDMETVAEMVKEDKALVYPSTYGTPTNPVKMHSGFVSAYLSVRDDVHKHVQERPAQRYRITGHSLGGALATLCAVDLQYNFGDRIAIEAYTFGAPRVGNPAFVESYNRRVPDTWRVVNGWDAVAGLPAPWQGYRHVETPIRLERDFTWKVITGSFEDHRIDHYIDALREKL